MSIKNIIEVRIDDYFQKENYQEFLKTKDFV